MFEAELLQQLNTITINNLLSVYNGAPAKFSCMAPEDVQFPYLVVTIEEDKPSDSIISRFRIIIEVFDYSSSIVKARDIVSDTIDVLDRIKIDNNEWYDDIRIWHDIHMRVEVPDPRGIQYRIEYEARATRSKWIKTFT